MKFSYDFVLKGPSDRAILISPLFSLMWGDRWGEAKVTEIYFGWLFWCVVFYLETEATDE